MTTRRQIEDFGKNNVLDLLPPLFKMVDTSENPNILLDTNYFVSPGSVIDSLYITLTSGHSDYEKSKKSIKMIQNLSPLIELFDEIPIDKTSVDTVVFSYGEKNVIRYKNLSNPQSGKSLYLDIQDVHNLLTDLHTHRVVRRILIDGLTVCGLVIFVYVLRKLFFIAQYS
uniref:Uncharacterized protein n=1 Tax=viral metagenome TaxID=1070528 RepID=A0A6C0B549_9ZZZZ